MRYSKFLGRGEKARFYLILAQCYTHTETSELICSANQLTGFLLGQCYTHIETSQLICTANELTGFLSLTLA